MRVDLLAGAAAPHRPVGTPVPTILVFDSGVGGLSVFAELLRARPDARFAYAADDAAFPYGALSEADLVARVVAVMERLVARLSPDIVVIACNTASTLVLPHLRRRFPLLPFVGTVPAIKPAVERSLSRRISVLATPGTVARDYTRDLVQTYAGDCRVTLVGSRGLAALAEAELCGAPGSDDAIRAELAPCFVEEDGARTDVVVLGCTHYPLLLERFQALAPWPVTWIDPAPAIARRVVQLVGGPVAGHESDGDEALALFTGGGCLTPALVRALAQRGLPVADVDAMPLRS
jgi:glutamate racemase